MSMKLGKMKNTQREMALQQTTICTANLSQAVLHSPYLPLTLQLKDGEW